MKARYVINVQILRFFAAFSVALAHIGVNIEDRGPIAGQTFRMIYPFDWGLGVDIFFIISGFIMYYLMHGRFRENGAPGHFLLRRFLRIVPLYWLTTTLTLVAALAAGTMMNNSGLDPAHIAASYLFFPWPRADGEIFPLLSLGWTLNYEMFFYFAFAAVLTLPRRTCLAGLTLAFAALSLAAALSPASWWLLRFWGNSIILEFLLGIGLAALFLRNARVSLPVAAALVLAGLAGASAFYQTASYEVLPRIVTGGLPALLIAAAFILAPHAPVKRPFTWLAVGGDASYALYLTHPFAAKVVAVAGAKLALPPLVIFAAGVAACIAVSLLAHFLFEKPVGAWLQRRLDRKATPRAA